MLGFATHFLVFIYTAFQVFIHTMPLSASSRHIILHSPAEKNQNHAIEGHIVQDVGTECATACNSVCLGHDGSSSDR